MLQKIVTTSLQADTSCSDSDFDKSAGLKNGKDLQVSWQGITYIIVGCSSTIKFSKCFLSNFAERICCCWFLSSAQELSCGSC